MYAHADDDRTPGSVARYGFKRLKRIYPAYLPVGLGMVALYIAMPGLSASVGGRDFSLVSSLFLIPANEPPALSVAWTLVHELMFYGMFLLFFASRRWLAGGLLVWALVILLANHSIALTGWLRYLLSILNIEFMFGVGAAWLVRSRALLGKGPQVAILGVAIASLALWLMTQDKTEYLHLMFAMGMAFLIVGFAVYEQSTVLPWPGPLLFLGSASYSIYLIHNPLLSLTQRLAGRMGLTWSEAMVFGVVICVVAGWIYYKVVERPAQQFFQKLLKSQ